MRRILTLVAAGALALAPLTAAGAASSAPQRIPSSLNIAETNAPPYVGVSSLSAGSTVTQVSSGSARILDWQQTGTYSNGDPEGYFQFTNGNYMAALSSCTGVQVKASSSDNGTVWVVEPASNYKLLNRYCVQTYGHTSYLEGDGTTGDSFGTGDTGGWFINMSFISR